MVNLKFVRMYTHSPVNRQFSWCGEENLFMKYLIHAAEDGASSDRFYSFVYVLYQGLMWMRHLSAVVNHPFI